MDFRAQAESLPWARGARLLRCDANGLLAIEKPEGVMSHPNKKAEIGRALLQAPYDMEEQAYRISDTQGAPPLRVFLLNRLDSATSGIVLLALSEETARAVLAAFEAKQVRKVYAALVFGALRGGPPVWKDRISVKREEGGVRSEAGGGALAETRLLRAKAIPGMPMMSLLMLMPVTGRTHQLRVQAAKRGVPIVGDRTYGDFGRNKSVQKAKGIKRLCLHCVETELSYTLGGKTYQFRAESAAPF